MIKPVTEEEAKQSLPETFDSDEPEITEEELLAVLEHIKRHPESHYLKITRENIN